MKKLLPITLAAMMVFIMCACNRTAAPNAEASNKIADSSSDYLQGERDVANPEQTGEGSVAPAGTEKKVIKDARVNLLAKEVKQAYEDIMAFAKTNGGYEFSREMDSGTYTTLRATIKIPAEKLDALLAHMETCGEVIHSQSTSTDITDSYYDTQTRLKTKRTSLEQYFKMLENANTVEDILRVQSVIDTLTEDIEALEGRLGMWNQLVAESTVTLSIGQKEDPSQLDVQWDSLSTTDMGAYMKAGLVKVLNTLMAVLQWLAIALVWAAPLAVIGGIVLGVLWFVKKRKKK